ncbi:MAG TPA: hypothetical protein VGG57_02290 [Stellaceae bacterium]|jgi:hypothetical protein
MRHRRVSAALLMAASIVPAAAAWADLNYQPAMQGVPAAPVEVGWSDQSGHVVPASTARPLPTESFSDRTVSVPAVSASAYASGNDVGGLNSLSFQGSGPIALVEDINVKSLSGQTPMLTVYLFDSAPQHSTFNDKGTFVLDTTTPGSDGLLDIDRLVIVPFAVTLAAGTGSSVSFGDNSNLARIPRSGAATLYYTMVSGSTFTPGSTTDLRVGVQVVQQHQ